MLSVDPAIVCDITMLHSITMNMKERLPDLVSAISMEQPEGRAVRHPLLLNEYLSNASY